MSRRPPTKADLRRFDKLQQIGCIISYRLGHDRADADIHHLTGGGRRLGHKFTIPLTPWRHRGTILSGFTKQKMLSVFGPSLAVSKKDFVAAYGTEDFLLSEVNKLIGEP